VHKDLAARNVLVGQHWEAKVCCWVCVCDVLQCDSVEQVSDFGMSRLLADAEDEHYSAREVCTL
jgi:hypothetical protein